MAKQILLHCISPDELKQLIKEVLKEEFVDFKKNLAIKESAILLTRSETCELLQIDSSTLWSWTNKGKITCYGIGARRYYKRDEILNCLVVLKPKKQSILHHGQASCLSSVACFVQLGCFSRSLQ